jgi:GNAT superfamily N-acetyltransferase
MDPFHLRIATAGDVAEITRIREEGGLAGDAERMARYLAGEHHPQHALAPRVIYVAEQGARMIGYIAGHRTTRYGCDGELQWIFVLPQRRGTGVADLLLDALATWFIGEGARRICVDVVPENARARRFYHRHGARTLHPHWLVWPDIEAARIVPVAQA